MAPLLDVILRSLSAFCPRQHLLELASKPDERRLLADPGGELHANRLAIVRLVERKQDRWLSGLTKRRRKLEVAEQTLIEDLRSSDMSNHPRGCGKSAMTGEITTSNV